MQSFLIPCPAVCVCSGTTCMCVCIYRLQSSIRRSPFLSRLRTEIQHRWTRTITSGTLVLIKVMAGQAVRSATLDLSTRSFCVSLVGSFPIFVVWERKGAAVEVYCLHIQEEVALGMEIK